MDGQCEGGLEGEGTVGEGDTIQGCAEATCQIHQPPYIQVGNDAIEAGEEDCIIHRPYMIARTFQVIYCNKNNE